MKTKTRQLGLSLTEVLTSIVIVVLLTAMSMPAINAIVNSTSSPGSSEAMISAALSNARAIAMREQRYAGVRFQNVYNPDNPLHADQYMIFIIHDPELTGTYGFGFKAIEGFQPIKLPSNIGVMDMVLVTTRNKQSPLNKTVQEPITSDSQLTTDKQLTDTSCFSIIFSPQGNLVVHGVTVWQRSAIDDVFNTLNTTTNELNGNAMFCQDDYDILGLGPEPSRRQFYIYEQDKFKRAYEQEPPKPYSDYLIQLKPVYINSYTGTIISAGQ